jgi:hypothetical protein
MNYQRAGSRRAISKAVLVAIASLLIALSIGAVLLSNQSSMNNPKVPGSTGPSNWSSLRGVNYFWTTVVDPNRPMVVAPPPWISFPQMRENGWNLIRVTMHWNEYEVDPSQYIANMQTIALYAQQNGLKVIWDLIHQAGTSSQYVVDGEQGVGSKTQGIKP